MGIKSYLLNHDDLSGYQRYLQEMATMWATSPNLTLDELKQVNAKTLIVVGDHYDVSLEHSVAMHDAIEDSELFVMPGATHFLHHEKPEFLHQVLIDFLKR